jgi:tetratricopeptide (TPR) repeat protein
MGWLALLREDYDNAIEYCNEAIRLDPENGPAYYSRGTARAAKGDTVQAVADYRQSLIYWKNINTKLCAHYAQEMRAYIEQSGISAEY